MSQFLGRLFRLPFHLVLVGVALGLIARFVYPPKTEVLAPRQFSGPMVEPSEKDETEESEFTDLPIE